MEMANLGRFLPSAQGLHMLIQRLILASLGSLLLLGGCRLRPPVEAGHLHRCESALTSVIVHDVFSPPVASRIYAYCSLAAWETLAACDPDATSMAGRLRDLQHAPSPPESLEEEELAALQAFCTVARALVFSEDKMADFEDALMLELGGQRQALEVTAARDFGRSVGRHILAWAAADGYDRTRTMPKHGSSSDQEAWIPTPPLFHEAIEPHWNSIRPFTLDSATQFIPPRPTAFDLRSGSSFREEVMEVYRTSMELEPEEAEIARFWDCNPYATEESAHLMPGLKKITPGGHWMGITRLACRQEEADFKTSAEAYALVSVALADAFISCWDEKYRSNLIRPETVINQHIDPDWTPLLETPPFPEYTSGHSVISASAAEMLSELFGNEYAYTDSVEIPWGLPPRNFGSFREASAEAAVSRLYGGIHYMPAITKGVEQGKAVGQHVVSRLRAEDES